MIPSRRPTTKKPISLSFVPTKVPDVTAAPSYQATLLFFNIKIELILEQGCTRLEDKDYKTIEQTYANDHGIPLEDVVLALII